MVSVSLIDNELVEIFQELGFRKNISKVLVFLISGHITQSRDIERMTDLRQPEVSVALKYLIQKQWVKVVDLITINKGRPVKLYQLSLSIDELLDLITFEFEVEQKEKLACIEKIRILVHDSLIKEKS